MIKNTGIDIKKNKDVKGALLNKEIDINTLVYVHKKIHIHMKYAKGNHYLSFSLSNSLNSSLYSE